MKRKKRVSVAISGGVDSAVACAVLLDRGYDVQGVFMQTWQDPKWQAMTDHLPSVASMAREIAQFLNIPLTILDVRETFFEVVIQDFLQQYLKGRTPNPCLFCNPNVKWGILQAASLEGGSVFFATGHYARLEKNLAGDVQLLRGIDPYKDQSYVLSMLSQQQLRRTLLPLGEMTKADVREMADSLGLPAAKRQDSQDLCFLGDVDYRDFLERYAPHPPEPGEIINTTGEVLGEHQGLAYYTIGQRRGLRIAASEPYYVIKKDLVHNRLVVGFAHQTGHYGLKAIHPNWIAGSPPEINAFYDVMIRYRAKPVSGKLISVGNDTFQLSFNERVRGITPGQVAVLYQDALCLGGGMIDSILD